jgi:hypothetical protein
MVGHPLRNGLQTVTCVQCNKGPDPGGDSLQGWLGGLDASALGLAPGCVNASWRPWWAQYLQKRSDREWDMLATASLQHERLTLAPLLFHHSSRQS